MRIFVFAMILFVSCTTPESVAQARDSEMEIQELVIQPKIISSTQAMEMMVGDVIILDVRTPEEFAGGHIENAVSVPLDTIQAGLDFLVPAIIPSKEHTILIYCHSGVRSNTAANIFANAGFMSVYDFGGIIDWEGDILN
ncbi:MAG: rhodanese-like domain-containing protein [Turicibacter sp.]|nr:rhodanese-like domain-containing protein [Turicibacter sp.]